MLTIGIVMLLLGFLLGIPILWTLGTVLTVVGAVLMLLGTLNRQVGPRRHYW